MFPVTLDSFADFIATRLNDDREALAGRWLNRLRTLLQRSPDDVFPGDDLLDHIPGLLEQIALYVRTPEAEEIAANASVIDKARELGLLRHTQQASLHQVLREYEILAEILEAFVRDEAAAYASEVPAVATLSVVFRIGRSVRALMRTTVESFIERYTLTIEEQSQRLDSFMNMIGHELRNPIGTLVVAGRLLAIEEIAADEQRRLRVIENVGRNTERLAELIEQLQRIGAGHTSLDLPTEQAIDVTVVGREVMRQLRTMAEERDVHLSVSSDLPTVLVDPARLELILINLVSNAIKYSDAHKSKRVVDITSAAAPQGYWALAVGDNGLGIPPDAQRTIFHRFVRAHASRDGELGAQGFGLGLAIVQECVEALDGTIVCESTVNVGTTFTLQLPLKQAGP